MESHPPASPPPAASSSPLRRFHLEEWTLVGLGALSVVGIGVTRFSAERSFRYWLYMAPIFAAVSIFTGWSRARKNEEPLGEFLQAQLLHWVSLPLAVVVVYRLQVMGRLDRQDAGLVTLLSIALTTYLAGVHFDWRIALLGFALGVAVLGAVLVEEFFWVFLVVAVAVAVFAWWRRRPTGA